ncbi:MAG: hypothetical protein GY705_08345 [Bacteroidetes bacterium]|nr:hypothetical protein [Bacteroidota bacterium]
MTDFERNERIINELDKKIDSTFLLRDKGEVYFKEWEAACANYHRVYPKLAFVECYDKKKGLRTCSKEALDASISFLMADPYYFRSGYIKEFIWRYLPSCQLNDDQRDRIEQSVENYLDRQICREFWYMCRAMNRIASKYFWERIKNTIESSDFKKKQRAKYLYEYRESISTGEKIRRHVYSRVLRENYEKS